MDRDRDGRISATELASVLESLGEERVEETVQAMMSQADTDGDGYVDFDEFIRVSSHSSWTSSLFEASPKSTLSASLASDCESAAEAFCCRGSDGPSIDDLAAAFELFDRNKDGFITAEELSEVMGGIWEDEDMSLEECERMIRSVDLDGDGRLCFSEFVDMMLASGSWPQAELSPCQTEQRNGGPPGDPRRRSRRAEGEPGTRRGGSGGPGGGEPGTRRGGSGGLGGWDTGTRRGGGGGPGGGESGTRRGGSGGGEAGRTGSSNRGGFSASGGGPKIEAPGFKGSGWGGTGSGSVFGKGFGQTGPGTSGSSSGPGEPGAPLPRWQKRQIVGGPDDDIDAMLADPERFERWQTSRELRGIQLAGEDPDDRQWEDWIDDPSEYDYENGGWYEPQPDWEKGGMPREAPDIPERGMSRSFKELLLRIFKPQDEVEESLTFEERVFRYTSQTTAKFVIFLIAVPWACSWVLHDYILTPFMHHYAHTTPLVARMLDLREEQKLNMIERLKLERQRIRFEADIGKAPPLSEDGLAAYLQEEAREMREEIRHENEAAFAYIFSDTVGWLIFAFILYANPSQVGIMKLTGDRIFTNISDTGKAFVIILCSDIFLGYHSESGWETVVEMFLDHYGLVADQNSIYIFVAIVPVTIDSFFKLWLHVAIVPVTIDSFKLWVLKYLVRLSLSAAHTLSFLALLFPIQTSTHQVFKYLVRLSPSAAATFREMKRH
ncbi:unnamed protein product [Closterium sp. NIES-65]|nr:unnamed protein product [Closterium sp. NIES-65]